MAINKHVNSRQPDFSSLVIAPSWIGDGVMSQPLLVQLAQQGPVDVLAAPWVSDLYKAMECVREVILSPFRHGALQLQDRWRIGRELARRNYGQAIVLPNSWKSAVPACFAGIPVRTGFRGEGRWLLLNDLRTLPSTKLLVERYAALGTGPCKPALPTLRIPQDTAQVIRDKYGLEKLPPLILCPGAEYGEAKRWPAAYFAEIGRRSAVLGWPVWVLGSAKDRNKQLEELLPKAHHLCGQTTLGEAMALLSLAQGVVTNDSGLMHVAAALGRPVTALFGSSDPQATPAQGPKVRMLYLGLNCSPCFQRVCPLGHLACLKDISPDMAWNALMELLRS